MSEKNAYIGALVLPNKCAAPGRWALSNVWAARLVDTWPTLDAICSSSSSSSAISSSSSRTSSSSSSSSAPGASSSAQSSDSSDVSSSSSSEIIYQPPNPPTSSTSINPSTNSENGGGDDEDDNNPPVTGSSASGPGASTTSGSGGDNSGGGDESGGEGCPDEEACIGTASNLTFVNPDNCNSYNGCVYELTDIDPNTGKQTWVVDQTYCGAGCECVPGEELEDVPTGNLTGPGPHIRYYPCQNNGEPLVTASPTFCNKGGAGPDVRNKTWTSPEGLTVAYNPAWLNPDNGQTEGRWEVRDPNSTENGGVLRWAYPYIGTSPDRDPSTIYPWELPGLGLTKVCP